MAEAPKKTVEVPGFQAEPEDGVRSRSEPDDAADVVRELPGVETVARGVALGELRVEILQRPSREMGRAEAAGEEVRAGAGDGAEGIAVSRVKEMVERAEHSPNERGRSVPAARWSAFRIGCG